MMNLIIILAFFNKFVYGTYVVRDVLDKYTKIATTTDGEPCLGGCSSNNGCVINWRWTKKPCIEENKTAPIYFTSQAKDKNNKQCWSNCGRFGHIYEWCVTSANNDWDYCSSQIRGTTNATGRSIGQSAVETYTARNKLCESNCEYDPKNGYTCYYKRKLWGYCAKQAITRVPTLPPDFDVGTTNKRNCEAFISNLINGRVNTSRFDEVYASDNFVEEEADDIEAAIKSAPETGEIITRNIDTDPVQSYAMVNIHSNNGSIVSAPAVIRAIVTNKTIRKFENLIDMRSNFADDDEDHYNWRIIGYELGGSSENYNFALQASRFSESWSLLEKAIKKWPIDTNGSVEMLVVVFYRDEQSVVPKAFGVTLTFNNPDGKAFVCCKDTIYWNR